MQIIKTSRRQVAVYWEPSSVPNNEGQVGFLAPVELIVRWEDVTQEAIDEKGNVFQSRSVVAVPIDVKLLGVLWLSTKKKGYTPGTAIAELTSTSDPFANSNAFEIRKFDKIPTLRANAFYREAIL